MKKFVMKKGIPMIPVIPFLVIAAMYLILPLISIVVKGFWAPGTTEFSLENFTTIFTKTIYKKGIENSIALSFYSTLYGLIVCFLAAMALTKVTGKANSTVMAILSMTSNFAGLPLAFAFMLVLGTNGVFQKVLQAMGLGWLDGFNLYSYDGLLLIFIYFQIPMGTMLLVPSFQAIRKEWREAATLMRCSGLRFWLQVGIPNLLPGLTGTFGMLFANSLTAYATPYVLLSNNYPLMATRITTLVSGDAVPKEELGAALTLVMIVIMLLVIFACNTINKVFYKGGESR